jgi:hypothetical protein
MQDRCISSAQNALPAPIAGRRERQQSSDPRLDHDRSAAQLLAAHSAIVERLHPDE